jgi:hypothetical protein
MLLHMRTLQKGLSAIYHLKNLLNCLERMLFCIIMLVLQIFVMDISCSVIIVYDSMLFVPTNVRAFLNFLANKGRIQQESLISYNKKLGCMMEQFSS